jgi:hypothetical protein
MKKYQECIETINEIKPFKQTDPNTVAYICEIFTGFGQNANATKLLEQVKDTQKNNEKIQKQLFFAYVRENKILKQQGQSLYLYKQFNKEFFAEWSIESMFLISK